MKRKLSLVAFAMTLALVMQASSGMLRTARAHVRAGGGASAQQASGASGSVAVIVELESEPVTTHQRLTERIPRREIDFESPSARAYEAQLASEHSDFKARAAVVSPNLRVRADLRKLANAVSVEVSPTELAAIAALPGVKRVELVKEVHTLLGASVPLINAPALWARLGGVGAAGQGMKIAILDTGIDITNPLFSDAGFTMPAGFPKTSLGSEALTNNKVIAAKSFLRPVSDAQDENGHGSNVAGIAAGSVTASPLGTISGVAPMAYLGNYRVLGADGRGRTDLIAQGIEQAVADGFDVLSMSFGASADTSLDITATASEAAVAAGKIVVIAAGNDGPDPTTIGSPAIAPSVITVAASTNAHVVGPVIAVAGPGAVPSVLTDIGSTKGSGSTAVFDSTLGPLPYVDADPQGRGCNGILAGSLNGKIALIERGNCDFVTKVNAAAAAGARAVIVFNRDVSENTSASTDGGDNLFTMLVTGTTIPSFFVIRSKGLALRDFVRANPGATVSIAVFGSGSFTPDVLAGFSSRGPSTLEGLKPDVAAPGVIIYSAAAKTGDPKNNGVVDPSGFLAISGTSQAAPHVAGAAALIKQLNPSFTPAQVKSALVSSATTDVFTTSDQTTRVGVLDTGGGRVDLARASSVSATFSPASLSFGIRKLKKNDVDVSLDLNITSLVDGQNAFTVSVQQLDPGDGVNVAPSVSAVSLARGQTSTITVRNTAIVGSQRRDYTGYVLVSGGGQTLHVPYWVRYVKKKN